MSQLLEQLLDAPDARLIIEQVQEELQREATQRQAFYDWIREDQKAEFINGEIILHSPVRRKHWKAVGMLNNLLHNYAIMNDLGEVATEKAMISLTRNDYEPDLCFWSKEKAAGFTDETMLHTAPDFVVEVLPKGTAKKDRGIKFTDYAAHGIAEYWLVETTKKEIEQYVLGQSGEYELKGKFLSDSVIESLTVAGFRLPVSAIFDEKENLKALRKLLAAQT